MTEDSGFFGTSIDTSLSPISKPELMYRSEDGWSELYRVDKNGRFRVYKALKKEYRGDFRYEEILKKEFQIGYSLSNPGICEVYGFVSVPDLGNCIEMDWIDGVSLTDFLKATRPTKDQAKRMILQICDILSYLHSKQIIHRDIKPSNLLVTHNGHNIKLIDFGLADSDSSSIIKTPAGTRSFAAPELQNGSTIDNRSDIYSLGKVIALLCPSLSRVVRKCTMTDPDKRYHSVEDISEAIQHPQSLWPWIAVIAAIVIGFIAVLGLPKNEDPVEMGTFTKEDITENDNETISDPAAIDELFQQATELIISRDKK